MKKIVVLTGAGISAESGLKTFRDSDGLWENHRIEDVATPEGWQKNPELVLEFYNERRKLAYHALPNEGHKALVRLEEKYEVIIVTQNVDNLHEKAGSSQVIHLHGELSKVRSITNEQLIYNIADRTIKIGDRAEDGGQLRPHIVWFGEAVPMIELAAEVSMDADIFIVVGTSLQVYPAAGLISFVPNQSLKYIIDPSPVNTEKKFRNLTFIQENATIGVPKLVDELLKK